MAMPTQDVIYGVDLSQQWLDIGRHGQSSTSRIANQPRAIDRWLKSLPAGVTALAVEATNRYHEPLLARAHELGVTSYLISGYQLKHYANSLNVRMRTDAVDAQLLARFLDREIDALRPYQPRSTQHQQLIRLLKRRALLVKQVQQLRQSFVDLPELKTSVAALLRQQRRLIAIIDRRSRYLAQQLGWNADLQRLRSLPGIGPLNALALCAAYHSGDFVHRDPFIAFLGLDVRTKDSGQHKGRRKLTKKGAPEYRRLLHNAAMAATRPGAYLRDYYCQLQQRGLCKTAALVAVARKLARMAFGVLKSRQLFDPSLHQQRCAAT